MGNLVFISIFLVGVLGNPTLAFQIGEDERQDRWEWFSDKGRVFAPLKADQREAQVRLGFLADDQKGQFLDLGFGGDLGLLHCFNSAGKPRISLTVRGLISSRFEFSSQSFDLLNTDFIGGVAFGISQERDSFEAFFCHQSSHLGDEILDREDRQRIDYSREAFRLLWAHRFAHYRLYGGAMINLRADPSVIEGSLHGHVGVEWEFQLWGWPAYVALDIQPKEENNWRPNITGQVGLKLGDPARIVFPQRVFLEYFNGYSNMGQFFAEREQTFTVGIAFSF